MVAKQGILGFYASFEHPSDESDKTERLLDAQTEQFNDYIWGKSGMAERLRVLNYSRYGKDIELILFEFMVFPDQDLIAILPEIEHYRPKEKSIGIPIIVTQENFFDKSEHLRQEFLESSIIAKLDLLTSLVAKENTIQI